ncbi:MAG: BlaI/MecI/CopY family transcriptional regulator [Lachnospiraceae bacterium]|nr:BlaI/MecI/CopY family transcriptional regulator [Lachnospiraceae bacterium]
MKRLPDSELELMMIIWDAGTAVTRGEIEARLPHTRCLSATTILTFLTRLQEKGFVKVEKSGRSNVYEALITREEYLQAESKSIWKRLYQGSVKNFMTALSAGEGLTDQDLSELQEFLDQKKGGR